MSASSSNGLGHGFFTSGTAVRFCLGLLLLVGLTAHAREIDLSAEHQDFYSFHGQSCDRTFREIAPHIGRFVRVQVGVWNVAGQIHGIAETPEHVIRLFVGSEVVTFIAGETLRIEQ